MRRAIALGVALCVSLIGLQSAQAGQPDPNAGAYTGEVIPCEFDGVERVVVVSRVNGEVERLKLLLEEVQVVNEHGEWIGGETHLVQLGNVFGRSEYVDEAARYMMDLEKQAAAAGGAVHVLLGVTEYLVLLNQPTQLNADAYARFASDDAEERRQELLDRNLEEYEAFLDANDIEKKEFYVKRFRDQFDFTVMPGAAEFFDTIKPGTKLGDWLRSRNSVVRIDGAIYSHSGISPEYKDLHPVEINQRMRNDIASKGLYLEPRLDMQSPIWWSGPLTIPDGQLDFVVKEVLESMGIPMMIIGRTRYQEAVTRRNRLVYVESRIPKRYERENMVALEVTDGDFRAFEAGATLIFGGTNPLPGAEQDEDDSNN